MDWSPATVSSRPGGQIGNGVTARLVTLSRCCGPARTDETANSESGSDTAIRQSVHHLELAADIRQ